jgi:hypothetical protein
LRVDGAPVSQNCSPSAPRTEPPRKRRQPRAGCPASSPRRFGHSPSVGTAQRLFSGVKWAIITVLDIGRACVALDDYATKRRSVGPDTMTKYRLNCASDGRQSAARKRQVAIATRAVVNLAGERYGGSRKDPRHRAQQCASIVGDPPTRRLGDLSVVQIAAAGRSAKTARTGRGNGPPPPGCQSVIALYGRTRKFDATEQRDRLRYERVQAGRASDRPRRRRQQRHPQRQRMQERMARTTAGAVALKPKPADRTYSRHSQAMRTPRRAQSLPMDLNSETERRA